MATDILAAVGLAVVHSFWIGCLVAAVTAACLSAAARRPAALRYVTALCALALMAIGPLVAVTLSGTAPPEWLAPLGGAWGAFALVMLARLGVGWRTVRRIARSAEDAPCALQSVVDAVAHEMGCRTRVLARVADVPSPCVVNARQPSLLLPPGLLSGLARRELRAIVAHELAHVRRRDLGWNLVLVALEAMLSFHPAARWLASRVRDEREGSCDQAARAICDPTDLGRALVGVEQRRHSHPWTAPATGRPLLSRIRLLVGAEPSRERSTVGPWTAAAVVTSASAALMLAPASAADGMAVGPAGIVTIAFGFVIGLRHVFEPDHLAAVTTLISGVRSPVAALRLGASWGVGHASALIAVAGLLAGTRAMLPVAVATALELAVAAMVIGLGAASLRRALRRGKGGPARLHRHGLIDHAHDGAEAHVHVGRWTLASRPLLVGVMHGLAGSGGLTALTVGSLPVGPALFVFLALFGLGSTIGMALVAAGAGWPITRARRHPFVSPLLTASTGIVAMAIGVRWAAPLVERILR